MPTREFRSQKAKAPSFADVGVRARDLVPYTAKSKITQNGLTFRVNQNVVLTCRC